MSSARYDSYGPNMLVTSCSPLCSAEVHSVTAGENVCVGVQLMGHSNYCFCIWGFFFFFFKRGFGEKNIHCTLLKSLVPGGILR